MNLILQAIKSMFRKVNMMFNQLSNKVEIAQTNAVEAKALAEKQSDWNQNDETAPDYIKNRTHYEIEEREIILPETTLNFNQTGYSGMQQIPNIDGINLIDSESYIATWDNVEYLCIAHSYSGEAIGNDAWMSGTTMEGFNPDAPFFIWSSGIVVPYETGEHTFKIEKATKEVHKLDKKFLPDDIGVTPDWNQFDETAQDYIKNKPFGDIGKTHLLAESKLPDHDSSYCGLPYRKFESDASYYLRIDGVDYQGFIRDGYNTLDFYHSDETRIGALFSPEDDPTSLELNLNYSYFNITIPLTFELIEVKCQKIDGKFLHVPDWNQNDENAPDYIKNKPFYDIETREVLVEETTFNVVNGRAEDIIRFNDYPDLGQTLTITFDGVEYESVMTKDSDECYWINFDTPQGLVEIYDNHTVYYNNNDGSHTIKIEKVASELKQLDEKFVPDSIARSIIDVIELPASNINENAFYRLQSAELVGKNAYMFHCRVVNTLPETGVYLDTSISKVLIYYNLSDGNAYVYADQTAVNNTGFESIGWYPIEHLYEKLTFSWGGIITNINEAYKDEATHHLFLSHNIWLHKDGQWIPATSACREGEGSKSVVFNDLSNKASGISSHAQGFGTHAQGNYSHAEGDLSHAKGIGSHSEGYQSYAEGFGAHSEGCHTYAQGSYSHAEGTRTYAQGENSHAEGYQTYAQGGNSRAEGEKTYAKDRNAHTEGEGTVAGCKNQHVQGQYNLIDPNYVKDNNLTLGKYAHIIGNGTNEDSRSNAHTLDWNGLAWFAGGLKVGGAGQDDENAKEVALKEDIAPAVEEAVAGMKDDLVSDVLSALPMWEGGNY